MSEPATTDLPATTTTPTATGASPFPVDGAGRLLQARRWIDDGAVSVVTLDMFDTVVWRGVPRPTDAFVLLATRLSDAGALAAPLDGPAFRRVRIEAERRARAQRELRGDGTEVTLDEIWTQFPAHLLSVGVDEAIAHEVDTELEVLRPDLDIADFADYAASRGCRLALVSNTYLSAAQLRRIVERVGPPILRDVRIFASSAYGSSKADGLWKIVLDQLDVRPDRVLHVGDELTSDVVVPGEDGIRTVHYRRLAVETEDVLDREETLRPDRLPPRLHAVEPRHGDYGLTGLRAKVGSRIEALDLPADQATAWHYGTTVLGPVLTGFADWVDREAGSLGARRIRCMMREGELLADLVGAAGRARRSQLVATPVWLSRAVTAKAVVTEANATELGALLNRRLVPTVAEYLANLGLGIGEVVELRHDAAERMDQPDLTRHVIETLIGDDHLRARIIAESAACRARLLRYLSPLLAEDGDVTVLVDLGWGATIQWQLQRALTIAGVDHRLVGLYLATNSSATPRAMQGLDVRGYLADFGEPYEAMEQIGRSPEIIEQSCLANCGSLVDFDGEGQPILDDSVPPPAQVSSKHAVQSGVRAFQREWVRYSTRDGAKSFDGGERPHLLEILRRSVTNPTLEEARTFGAWTHDDNFGVNRREEVIAPRLGAYAPYLSASDLAEMTMHEAFWPLGLAAEYDPSLAATTRTILSGQLRTEDFEISRRPTRVSMSVDAGRGWQSGQTRPLRINRNGLSYARFDLRAEGIRTVRFDPCDGPAIWRIDWIELGLRLQGTNEPRRVRLEGADALGALVYSGCRWLYDGVGIGLGDHCEIQIPLGPWAPGGVYGVELTVAMAVLALPSTDTDVALTRGDFGTSVSWALAKVRAEAGTGGPMAVGRGALRYARRRLG